jgi:HEXXH motif-containing protein
MPPTESIREEIDRFIRQPFPLWETDLTDKLVAAAYEDLQVLQISDRLTYHTATALLQKQSEGEKQFLVSYGQKPVYLEAANAMALYDFYHEHGLVPLTKRELVKEKAATKLKAALNLLATLPECIECIASLVNCIQMIASEGPDYDTSYSHPDIPFTVFISICQDSSILSSLRVAENILHEAMHLKLSLIQGHVQLIKPDCQDTFYSPWRDTHRPLVGVLHGLFVFRAILDFYSFISLSCGNGQQLEFLQDRITMIKEELGTLAHFGSAKGLTKLGGNFATKLLQY